MADIEKENVTPTGIWDFTGGTIKYITAVNFLIDGSGSAIGTGIHGDVRIPFDCTIKKATLLADQSTSTTIDIWKDTYTNFPPTDTESITGGDELATSASNSTEKTDLSNWTTSITAGDILRFNVDSNDNATRVTIILNLERT